MAIRVLKGKVKADGGLFGRNEIIEGLSEQDEALLIERGIAEFVGITPETIAEVKKELAAETEPLVEPEPPAEEPAPESEQEESPAEPESEQLPEQEEKQDESEPEQAEEINIAFDPAEVITPAAEKPKPKPPGKSKQPAGKKPAAKR